MNSVNDRETPDYTAMEYIDTIAGMLRHYDEPVPDDPEAVVHWETRSFITHVAYLEGSSIDIDIWAIEVSLPLKILADRPGARHQGHPHPEGCALHAGREGATVHD